MIGIAAVAGRALMSCVASQPSMAPSATSIRIRSGISSSAMATPVGAVGRAAHREAVPLQPARQHVAVHFIVFDEQDLKHWTIAFGCRCPIRPPGPGLCAEAVSCGIASASASCVCARTTVGRRMVKQLPMPSSLSTVMSPPIKRQSFWLSARPKPVPPYLLELESSATRELLEQGRQLVPGDADAGVAAPPRRSLRRHRRLRAAVTTIEPVCGELGGIVEELRQGLPSFVPSQMIAAELGRRQRASPCCRSWPRACGSASTASRISAPDIDRLDVELHLAGLDLREVEHSLTSLSRWWPALVDLLEVGGRLVVVFVARRLRAGSGCSRSPRSAACAAHGSSWRGTRPLAALARSASAVARRSSVGGREMAADLASRARPARQGPCA